MGSPALSLQIQGQTSVSADNLNTYIQTCTNIPMLRSFIGTVGMQVEVQGLSTPDDGGEGTFLWQATVTQPDDGRNYVIPTGANNGGWVRQGPLLVLPIPVIIGALSAVTDANAKVVITSIIAALTSLGLVTNGTT